MSAAHDRFEVLAGAVALGEATEEERARFDDHARACPICRDDVDGAALVLARLEFAREGESWRPSIRSAVFARIHERHALRSRIALRALAWVFVVWVVIDAALASGVPVHLGRALSDAVPRSDVIATTRVARRPAAQRGNVTFLR